MSRDRAGRKPRVLVVGIEVAAPATIEYGIASGRLPHLSRLVDRGSFGRMHSVCDLSSGCIWPSFQTGRGPGSHGFAFYHMQLVSGTYRVDKLTPSQLEPPPFWELASEAGRRCAVIDVPITRPVELQDGVQLVGWGVEAASHRLASWPPGLVDELVRIFGHHPLQEDDRRRFIRPTTPAGVADTAACLLEGVEKKTDLLEEVAGREPWDLFLCVFGETHWAHHVLYHVFDPDHPEYRPELAEAAPDFRLQLLEAHDRAIGRLMAAMPDADVVVFSGSGPSPAYSGNHLLPEVLERLGYAGAAPSRGAFQAGLHRIRALNDRVPAPILHAVKSALPDRLWDRWTRRVAFAGSGWARSRAFALVNDWSGSVRINLAGREPRGTVPPEEYDAVCDALVAELGALELEGTGAPAVEAVIKVRDAFPGPHRDDLPDLCVVWARDAAFSGLQSPRIGHVRGSTPEKRPGAHSPDAFLLLSGPDFARDAPVQAPCLIDLAPTLLALLGVAVPDDFDGRVLGEALQGS